MDFIYLLRVLLKRKWIIIASGLIAAALAFFLTQNQKKQYRSTSQVSTGFTNSQRKMVGEENAIDYFEAENNFNNALVRMTSTPVLSLVSYNLMLNDLNSPTPFHKLDEEKKQSHVYKAVNQDEAKTVLKNKLESMTLLSSFKPEEKNLLEFIALYGYDLKTLKKFLNIYRYERSDLIQIDYSSDHPELSAFVVNDVFDQFMRYSNRANRVYSKEAIDTLKSIMDRKKDEFDIKVAQAQKLGFSYNTEVGTEIIATAGNLEQSLTQEKIMKSRNESELQKVNRKLANLGTGTDNDGGGNNNEQIFAAQKARDAAYNEYLKNPKDKALYDRFQLLKKEYDDLVRQQGTKSTPQNNPSQDKDLLLQQKSDLETDIQANNRNIASIQTRISALKGQANEYTLKSNTADAVKNELDVAQKDWAQAKQVYNNAITAQSSSSLNKFSRMLEGQPAMEPEPSKRKIIIALAGIAAMVTTMLIIIFLTYLDSSIKTPIIFSKSVNLKLMSMVNFMDLRNKNLADIVANRDSSDNTHDRSRFNAFRESIRKLRYEIESTGKKVFLFTSTKKGQGKTTLIQALSYSMSLSKKKILIIDTNFCNNDLTVQLDAKPVLEKIVPQNISGKAFAEQIKDYSKDIGVGSVFAIGSEGGDYTPSEILPRENLLHHLEELTADFDYIFLEGPPLNDFSDSKELAQYVDGVIAVFSAQHIIKQIDKQSIGFFKELNGKFCGSILNMVDLKNVTLV